MTAAADALEGWAIPATAIAMAIVGATGAALGVFTEPFGLAITILGLLAFGAERGLAKLAGAATPGLLVVIAMAVGWVLVCYAPFHPLLFPGDPLHAPVALHAADPNLPITIPTAGHGSVEIMLEGQLPPNPSGGPALPVQYSLTIGDAAGGTQVVTGRFDEQLKTQRLGRRGSATVIQAHHGERHLVSNHGSGDLVLQGVTLEPSAGSAMTVTAFAHHLPSFLVLVLVGLAVLAGVVAIDTRLIPDSDGTLTFITPAAFGAAIALWTSNTVHPTVSSLIGATIFGGPAGLAVGALLWAVARRTLVDARR
jgi:hypothetical protein